MPPHVAASPKKKRSKHKASDASKAGLPKKPRAANVAEIPSMPLVSLGLTEADAGTAPRHSDRPNVGTGGRNTQLEKIRVALEAKSQSWKPKGATSLGTLNPVNPQAPEPPRKGRNNHPKELPPPYSPDSDLSPSTLVPNFSSRQSGERFGFAASTTAHIVPPAMEPNPQVLTDPYLAEGMKVTEKRNQNALVTRSSQPPSNATFSERNLDPALCKEDGIVRRALHRWLVGFDPEDGESSSSGTDIDIDKGDEGDNGDEGDKEMKEMKETKERITNHSLVGGELTNGRKNIQDFQLKFQFQYSRDEDDDSAWMRLNNSNQPLDTLPGVQQERPDTQTTTSKPNNVLKRYHNKNGQPRLPDPEGQPRTKKSKGSDGRPRPDQLAWYGPRWKSFLEEAKGECRGQHALENPFPPLVKGMPGTISKVLLSVLVAWDKNSRQFEAGVWPEQQYNMTLLFHCIFDGLKKNGSGKCYPNFSSKEYLPIYRKMLRIIKDTLQDEYHGPRLLAQLREWAEAGWAENLKLDSGAAETRHDHLQVILD
ncbi:hypothetical protein DFH29DRAFT_1002706 [Suillus ampliporus]|nr:hypothetical protein DFH29DRAFT_1002706 [Suillus ampliporus]